jgi:hypothetical protein
VVCVAQNSSHVQAEGSTSQNIAVSAGKADHLDFEITPTRYVLGADRYY